MPEFAAPRDPTHESTQKAYLILKYAHDTAESLLDAFSQIRGGRRGAPTDEEQDLLRAMVVFAGAGIDSMTKQLVRDALPAMVAVLPDARRRLEKLAPRHLRRAGAEVGEEGLSPQSINPLRLAKVLLAETPREGVVELLVDDLTSGSLQSVEELYKIAEYMGLRPNDLGEPEADIREVFDCRNRLIHEMDVDFSQPNRNRFSRRRDDMVGKARTLLNLSNRILSGVDRQLPEPPRPRRGRPPRS